MRARTAAVSLTTLLPLVLAGGVLALGLMAGGCQNAGSRAGGEAGGPVVPGEVEATEFEGVQLTPISEQGNNALKGTQTLERDTYTLVVDGLVEHPLSLSYDDLQAYEQKSRLVYFKCVEGWGFTVKWTGPSLADILEDAGVKPEAAVVIFYVSDLGADTGYTSLDLQYVLDNDILLGMKLNDITLPYERGFPFQVVAEGKYGYKWAKWVIRIELSDNTLFKGFWEKNGYNNNADDYGPAFE